MTIHNKNVVFFSKIERGKCFFGSSSYGHLLMKTEPIEGVDTAGGKDCFNAVDLNTGLMHVFEDDYLVIPADASVVVN